MMLQGPLPGVPPHIFVSEYDENNGFPVLKQVRYAVRWHSERAEAYVPHGGIVAASSDVALTMQLNQLSAAGWTIYTVMPDGVIVVYRYEPEEETS